MFIKSINVYCSHHEKGVKVLTQTQWNIVEKEYGQKIYFSTRSVQTFCRVATRKSVFSYIYKRKLFLRKNPSPSSVSIFKENYLHQWSCKIEFNIICHAWNVTKLVPRAINDFSDGRYKWSLSASSLIYSSNIEDDFCRNERWLSCCRNHKASID